MSRPWIELREIKFLQLNLFIGGVSFVRLIRSAAAGLLLCGGFLGFPLLVARMSDY